MATTPFAQEPGYLRTVLDAFPAPVFVLSADFEIEDANVAAVEFAGNCTAGKVRKLCGDLLHCVRARTAPGGCGTSEFCKDCVVRNSFGDALRGQKLVRRRAHMLLRRDSADVEIDLLVSATPFRHADCAHILLTLEDVTEVFTLRRLIPICCYCRKVRDDQDYWRQVESYLHQTCNLKFSHGICPECMEEMVRRGEIPPDTPPDR